MFKRFLPGFVVLAVSAMLLAPTAQAGKFQQRVSGSFTDTAIDTNGDGMAANVVTGGAKGTGGTASYDGVLEVKFDTTGLCAPGEVEAVIVAYSIVRRYANGDLLFSRLVDGNACFDPGAGTATIDINAAIIGGTGRFDDATGTYAVSFEVIGLLPDAQGGLAHAALSGRASGDLG